MSSTVTFDPTNRTVTLQNYKNILPPGIVINIDVSNSLKKNTLKTEIFNKIKDLIIYEYATPTPSPPITLSNFVEMVPSAGSELIAYKFDEIHKTIESMDINQRDEMIGYIDKLKKDIHTLLEAGYNNELSDQKTILEPSYFSTAIPVLFVISSILVKLLIVLKVIRNATDQSKSTVGNLKQLLLDTTKLLINIDSFDVSTASTLNPVTP